MSDSRMQQKIDYLKQHYPNWDKIDPYVDHIEVNKIKDIFSRSPFYKITYPTDSLYPAIVNLVLRAQSKSLYKRNCRRGDKP